jgi:predicted Rossmann fold flavoprotein
MADYDVIVLGAGAAGLMCAIEAGKRGRRVLVLERANKVGKKILMSGGGRCNFTNLNIEPGCYLSRNPHFCKSALSQYTQWDFIELVKRHNIPFHEKTQGQLFCDHSSKDILAMLLAECQVAGVTIRTDCEVETVSGEQPFTVLTKKGNFEAGSLVIATGGLSIPTLGGSGFGYELARHYGLSVLPTRAGLVPFTFTDATRDLCDRLSGVSLPVSVSTDGHSFADSMLFTHRGLSGPAILQLSSYWAPGQVIRIDLLPGVEAGELLKSFKQDHPRALLRTLLARHLPAKLVAELEQLWWLAYSDIPLAEIPDKVLTQLASNLNGWPLKPAGSEGYRTAEVTLGGVSTDGLSSKTMECKAHPGLYFIGEVVDVTGHLGGYNFQWAWSSGYVAGQHC